LCSRTAPALEHVGRDDPDAAAWRERIARHQLTDCRLLAERLAHEHQLAPGWTMDSATDMLWALISTEPLERLLVDRGWPSQQYAQRSARLLRSPSSLHRPATSVAIHESWIATGAS
jgi:hypothetical protein